MNNLIPPNPLLLREESLPLRNLEGLVAKKTEQLRLFKNSQIVAPAEGPEEAGPLSISPPEGESIPCPLPLGEGLGEGLQRYAERKGFRGWRRDGCFSTTS